MISLTYNSNTQHFKNISFTSNEIASKFILLSEINKHVYYTQYVKSIQEIEQQYFLNLKVEEVEEGLHIFTEKVRIGLEAFSLTHLISAE